MNFLSSIQSFPNQAFSTLSLTNEDSPTLAIGQDCLQACHGNPLKAVEKFKNHTAEIILTHLHNLLSSQIDTNHEVLSEVVRILHTVDQSY